MTEILLTISYTTRKVVGWGEVSTPALYSEVPRSIPVQCPIIHTDCTSGFLQSLQVNTGIMP
jgi:hypothetical protein